MDNTLPPLKRIAAIHDLSGLGKCSLTVALPVVSATGVECACIPTAVLSTHTGEFTGWTFRDLSDDMLSIAHHWQLSACASTACIPATLLRRSRRSCSRRRLTASPRRMPSS